MIRRTLLKLASAIGLSSIAAPGGATAEEKPDETKIRSTEEVISRVRALLLVAYKAIHEEPDTVARGRAELSKDVMFSPTEMAFLDDANPPHDARVQHSWGCEAALPMIWALGLIELNSPSDQCDPGPLFDLGLADGGKALRRGQLRNARTIDDMTGEYLHFHWMVRDAQLRGKPIPDGLDAGVVMERHKALNWLTCYGDQDWDDVTTDT